MDTAQTNPTPQPETSSNPVNEAIIEVKNKAKLNPKLLYAAVAAVVLLLAGASYYAYSQGSLPFVQPSTTSNAPTTPTVSSDVQSLDSTASDVQNDLDDVDSTTIDLDGIDTTNDQTPQL